MAVMLSNLEEGNNVRVVEDGNCLHLGAKAADLLRSGQQCFANHLQSDKTERPLLAPVACQILTGLVDDAHSSPRNLLQELVVPETAGKYQGRRKLGNRVGGRRSGRGAHAIDQRQVVEEGQQFGGELGVILQELVAVDGLAGVLSRKQVCQKIVEVTEVLRTRQVAAHGDRGGVRKAQLTE